MHITMLSTATNVMGNAVTKHLDSIASELAKRGNTVNLLVPSPGDEKQFKNIQQYSILFYGSAFLNTLPFVKLFIKDVALATTLLRSIHNTDVYYVRFPVMLLTAVLLRIIKIPVILEVNGVSYNEQKQTLKGMLMRVYYRIMFWLNLSISDHCVCVSESIKNQLITDYNNKSEQEYTVVSNGVDMDLFTQPLVDDDLNIDTVTKYIFFVGAINHWQNLEVTLFAADRLKHENITGWKFLIVGDGPEREQLQARMSSMGLQDYFEWVGAVPHDEVPKYANTALFAIAPFVKNRQASPIKIYEYLASGLPVIYANIDGLHWVAEKNFGTTFMPEDSEEFSKIVYEYIVQAEYEQTDPDVLKAYVKSHYSWTSSAEKVESVLRQYVGNEE